jgi:hypothetical protein
MPSAAARVSINGGANQTSANKPIVAPSAATVALSSADTSFWTQQRWEIYAYPDGWTAPVGWSTDANGVIYSTSVTPSSFSLPANTTRWGKWGIRLTVNNGLVDGVADASMVDESLAFEMLSPSGLHDLMKYESNQFGADWTEQFRENLRELANGGNPGGSNTQIQYNNAGVFAGVGNVIHNAGNLSLSESAPTTGTTGQVTVACVQRAGKRHLVVGDGYVSSWVRATGGSVVVGPHPGHVKQSFYNPWGNAETSVTATFTMSLTGTLGAPSVASTSLLASTCRIQSTSATAIGSFASLYESSARLWRGNAADRGGFYLVMRFAPEDAAAVSGARMFVGLHTSVAGATNVEPNTLTSILGVCQLSTSNNLHLINNDGTGTATTVDLGASFPANGNTAAYELTMWCPPNESFVGYRIERLDTGDVSEGTWTTDLPPNTTFLARRAWRTNNAQALAVKMTIISIYAETLV